MTLLALEHVVRRHPRGPQPVEVLRDVSLRLDAGELLAIWGARRSGRSTLLRVCAGVEPVDAGVVRFGGADLRSLGHDVLGGGIGYCRRLAAGGEGRVVQEELLLGQLARGIPARIAGIRADEALERAGVPACAHRRARELDAAEAVRVAIARALVLSPPLLIVDEPVNGVDLLERDGILALLRSLADEGTAVLMSAGEATALAGVDRALSLSDGELRGALHPRLAEVLPLQRRVCA